ncbi:MAG: tail fiber domain-containing protein [Ferruginibacter sp.]
MKKICFIFLACLLFKVSFTQNVGINTNTPNASALLHIETGGNTVKGLLLTGVYNYNATVPDLGAGQRLMFYPSKVAFRAGSVNGTQWDNINTGLHSIGLGNNVTASGYGSVSIGYGNTASADYSYAFGYNNVTTGNNAVAIGTGNLASFNNSMAIGEGCISSATNTLAMGRNTTASGHTATTFGLNTGSSGQASTAFGQNTVASGSQSTAMGWFTKAKGQATTVVGMYNDSILLTDEFAWSPTTPLFIVGNGSADNTRRNALVVRKDGKVGIGTSFPLSRLHVADSSVIFSADNDIPVTPGNLAISGAGRRMIWYPDKAAFRAGYVSATQWNSSSVGNYSVAIGLNNTASGPASTAMGASCNALAAYAFSAGFAATASAAYSTSIGYLTTASGIYSSAFGGYVSTNGQTGAFVFGDNSTTTITDAGVANSFTSRFAGGYRLFSNSTLTTGMVLAAGGNSWSAVSDVKRKENFLPVIGEDFLQKISTMPLTTWNYKGQDVKKFRHYGPMAQDFYKAFGRDELGEIGCDSLINQQDFLGVNLIAIQALEKRTAIQEHTIQNLQIENIKHLQQNLDLNKVVADLIKRIEALEKK